MFKECLLLDIRFISQILDFQNMGFTTKDISDYYNQAMNHYQYWLKLSESLSVYYGIWLAGTKTFILALSNTNSEMARIAEIRQTDSVQVAVLVELHFILPKDMVAKFMVSL